MNKSGCQVWHARRGTILVAVLICLLAVGLIGAGLVRLLTLHPQQLRMQSWQQQAAWLAESGLSRARSRLAEDDQYEGETWQVPAEQLDGKYAGVVTIQLQPVDDEPQQQTLLIEAIYPDDPIQRALHRIEIQVTNDRTGDAS